MVATHRGGTQAPPQTLSTEAAAARLGWTDAQVRRALRSRTLRGFKPNPEGRWLVTAESVDAALRYATEGGVPAGVPDKLRRFSRLTAELTALTLELADDFAGVGA